MKHWILGLLMTATLGLPATTYAHEGHAHKVMGTIASVDGKTLSVKTADGKTTPVMLDAKTKITRGTAKLDASALKVGDRVVAEGAETKGTITAATLKLGEVPAAAAPRK
jgi:hypothetical protein